MHAIAHQSARLTAYAFLATILVAAIALELLAHDTGWWQLGVFGMGADLALLAGAGSGLAQGQLHPRAVPLYNAAAPVRGPRRPARRGRHRIARSGLVDRRTRLGLPHRARSRPRLRTAHPRRLPACLASSPRGRARSSPPPAGSSRRRAPRRSPCAASPSASASARRRCTSTFPTSRRSRLRSSRPASRSRPAAFEQALEQAPDDPLGALAAAYREFARRHPHLYRLMTDRPAPRDQLVPGVEARAGLPIYRAAGENPDLARAAWAFAHGMTILELNRAVPARRRPRCRLARRNPGNPRRRIA